MDEDQYNLLMMKGLLKIRKVATLTDTNNRIIGIRKLRGMNDKDVIRSFFHYVLSNMISNSLWSVGKSEQRAGLLFSIHDEAFSLLVMMNNWEVWEQMALGEKRGKGISGKTLFTNKTVELDDFKVCIKGWSNEGLKVFNEILNYLATVRNNANTINMENELMLEYKNLVLDKSKKRRRDYNDNVLLEERVRPFDGYSMNFEQV